MPDCTEILVSTFESRALEDLPAACSMANQSRFKMDSNVLYTDTANTVEARESVSDTRHRESVPVRHRTRSAEFVQSRSSLTLFTAVLTPLQLKNVAVLGGLIERIVTGDIFAVCSKVKFLKVSVLLYFSGEAMVVRERYCDEESCCLQLILGANSRAPRACFAALPGSGSSNCRFFDANIPFLNLLDLSHSLPCSGSTTTSSSRPRGPICACDASATCTRRWCNICRSSM